MSRKSNAFNRFRTYLRNNRIKYSHSFISVQIGNILISDLPISEYFLIRIQYMPGTSMQVPHCEPDTLLAKAYSFRNTVIQSSQYTNRMLNTGLPLVYHSDYCSSVLQPKNL